MNAFLSIFYVLGLYGAFVAGSLLLRSSVSVSPSDTRTFPLPQTTSLLLLAISVPSVLQFFFPALLLTFQRDFQRFLAGEYWRLISALFVQDGGISGTIFNLIGLAFVGSVVERIWNGRSLLLIFFLGGIIGEFAGFAWQPIGAGNSLGNFSLAASIAVASLKHSSPTPVKILAILALGVDAILFGLQDIHGAAAIAGALLALFLNRGVHNDSSKIA